MTEEDCPAVKQIALALHDVLMASEEGFQCSCVVNLSTDRSGFHRITARGVSEHSGLLQKLVSSTGRLMNGDSSDGECGKHNASCDISAVAARFSIA